MLRAVKILAMDLGKLIWLMSLFAICVAILNSVVSRQNQTRFSVGGKNDELDYLVSTFYHGSAWNNELMLNPFYDTLFNLLVFSKIKIRLITMND